MPATDRFSSLYSPTCGGLDWPLSNGEAVTPHDTNELTRVTRALWIGGAGNVNVVTSEGTTLLLSGVQAGTLIPLRVKQVKSTSTTATLIVALD